MPLARHARPSLAVVVAIVIFYAVLGLIVLSPEAVYSGDIGVKYVQAQALVSHRFASLDIPYPGQNVDPGRDFFPLRPPFVMTIDGVTQSIFPPASSVLQAIAVAVFGLRGMIVLTLVSAAVVIVCTMALVPPRMRVSAALAIGLGSPLWFYAVSGWEHAPAIAFGAACFAIAARRAPVGFWPPVLAGALLGAGATLRDEVLLLLPGLLFAWWLRDRRARVWLAALGGAAVPLLLAGALEVFWFGRPPAAHLQHAVHLVQTALHVTSAPNPELPVLQPMTTRERYDTVVTYWLLGRGTDRQVAAFVIGFLVALLVRRRWKSSAVLWVWLVVFGATSIADLWEVVTAPKWLAGLVRVVPFCVLALLPRPRPSRPNASPDDWLEPWLFRVTIVTSVSFIAIAFAGVDTSGGKSLGPRLLLPLVPLLTASAVSTVASYWRATAWPDRLIAWTGLALGVIALGIHLAGTIPAYRARNAEDASAVRAVSQAPVDVIVADDVFTAQLLLPIYDRKVVLLVDTPELAARLGQTLSDWRFTGALLVSRDPARSVPLLPLRLASSEQRGRFTLQYWRR